LPWDHTKKYASVWSSMTSNSNSLGEWNKAEREQATAVAVAHQVVRENPVRGLLNRLLQLLTLLLPGGQSLRVLLHRMRGVQVGKNAWISYNVILETAYPELITIGDDAFIGIGTIVIAHFREARRGVRIGNRAFVGPGVIVLPDVEIGDGAVITAGSVVTSSVPAMTVAQGNPAVPIAKCSVPLVPDTNLKEFSRRLQPLPGAKR
jgi:acetyltransferase-like isoleucine patch superfamily enzyme